jgi:hypothetical protein
LESFDEENQKKDINIAAVLTFKMLSRMVEKTPKDDEFVGKLEKMSLNERQSYSATSEKSIDPSSIALQTSSDLELLVFIFRKQNKYEEALSILDDDAKTGLQSSLACGKWNLVREKIEILQHLKKWTALWDLCHALLLDAETEISSANRKPFYSYGRVADDWLVWRLLVESCNQIDDSMVSQITKELFGIKALNQRNRDLALIEYCIQAKEPDATTSLSNAVAVYQEKMMTKSIAYKDLSHFIPRLPAAIKQEIVIRGQNFAESFMHKESPEPPNALSWITAEINSMKLDYTIVVSKQENLSSIPLLESFAASCLSLYKLSLDITQDLPVTERLIGDDAAILASNACIHLFHEGRNEALLQAILILEDLLSHSKHNYDAILLIVRLYIYLGVPSRAVDYFRRLDIKNIQILTESWILWTRIASLYPYAPDKSKDIFDLLQDYAFYIEEKGTSQSKIIESYLKHENMQGICEAHAFFEMWEHATSKYLLRLELDRLIWKRGNMPCHDRGFVKKVLEVRDVAAFPNYEHPNQPSIENYIRTGPMPSHDYIMLQKLAVASTKLLAQHNRDSSFLTRSTPDYSVLVQVIGLEIHGVFRQGRKYHDLTPCEEWCLQPLIAVFSTFSNLIVSLQTYFSSKISTADHLAEWEEKYLRPTEDSIYRCLSLMEVVYHAGGAPKALTADPAQTFATRNWEVFHVYNVTHDVLHMYFVCCQLIKMICSTVSEIKHIYSFKTSFNDVSKWETIISQESRRSLSSLLGFDIGMKVLHEHWRDGDNVKKLIGTARGVAGLSHASDILNRALQKTLDEDFVTPICFDIARCWTDLFRVTSEHDRIIGVLKSWAIPANNTAIEAAHSAEHS